MFKRFSVFLYGVACYGVLWRIPCDERVCNRLRRQRVCAANDFGEAIVRRRPQIASCHSIFVPWRVHRHQCSISPIHSSDNKIAGALQHLSSFFLVTVLLAFGFHSAGEALAAGFSRRGRRRREQAQAFRALRHAVAPS